MHVEALGEGEEPAVGAHAELGGVVARVVRALLAAVEADADEQSTVVLLLRLGDLEVDAIGFRAELRVDPAAGEERGLGGAVDRRLVDAGTRAPRGRDEEAAAGLGEDDGRAVGADGGVAVVALLARERAVVAAVDVDDGDGGELLVVPGGVEESRAVAGVRRGVLEAIGLRGEATGRAVGKVLHVDVSERVVRDLPAVGPHDDVAEHLDVEGGGRDVDGEADGLGHRARGLHAERDGRELAVRDIDLAEAALRVMHDGAAVGRPGHRGVDAVDGPRLLHVAFEVVDHLPLDAALEVADEQARLEPHAADEGQRRAVGAGRRAACPAGARRHRLGLAGDAIEAADGVDALGAVLVVLEGAAGRRVPRVVEVPPVGAEGRLVDVLLVGGLGGELQAIDAAVGVVEPHLARAQRAAGGEVLAGHDVVARGGQPRRAVEQAERLLGHLLDVGAVELHRPDVVAAAAVGGEGQSRPVGAESRLHVPRGAAGETRRLAARDGQRVEVAQQVEDDGGSVGAHVEREPRAAGDVEGDVPCRTDGRVDVPPLVPGFLGGSDGGVRRLRGLGRGGGSRLERKQQAGDGRKRGHGTLLPTRDAAPLGTRVRALRGLEETDAGGEGRIEPVVTRDSRGPFRDTRTRVEA